MAFTVNTLSLSSLNPVKLSYTFNSTESLQSKRYTNDNNLTHIEYDLLNKAKDAVMSKHTTLALTDIKDLKSIFTNKIGTLGLETISSSFSLNVPLDFLREDETEVKMLGNDFFVGGKGTVAVFNIIPIGSGLVELKVNENFVQVEKEYPYSLILSTEALQDNDVVRQQFYLKFINGHMTIKTITKNGSRFLASGFDRTLRFVGMELNESKVNNSFLIPTFVSSYSVSHGFNPSTNEIRYYNGTSETNNQKTVSVKNQTQLDTNLLVSCPTVDLAENDEVGVNISLVKTNFSSAGTFNTSL
jgi:hypothetical protein